MTHDKKWIRVIFKDFTVIYLILLTLSCALQQDQNRDEITNPSKNTTQQADDRSILVFSLDDQGIGEFEESKDFDLVKTLKSFDIDAIEQQSSDLEHLNLRGKTLNHLKKMKVDQNKVPLKKRPLRPDFKTSPLLEHIPKKKDVGSLKKISIKKTMSFKTGGPEYTLVFPKVKYLETLRYNTTFDILLIGQKGSRRMEDITSEIRKPFQTTIEGQKFTFQVKQYRLAEKDERILAWATVVKIQ